jgi:hypothetical protein
MPVELIYVELRIQDCCAELFLNEIPIGRIGPSGKIFLARPANSILVKGTNTLEVLVDPGPTPSQARRNPVSKTFPAGAYAQARLAKYREGAFVGSEDTTVLAQARWPDPDESTPQLKFPLSIRRQISLDSPFGNWVWERADVIDPAKDFSEVSSLVTELHRAFAAGNPEPFLRLSGIYFRETAVCFPDHPVDEQERRLVDDIGGNAGRRNWVRPLVTGDLDFRVCAGGRLVECICRDWTPVLNTLPQDDGDQFPLPLFLGRFEGKWQILR